MLEGIGENGRCTFLELPIEIRTVIYRHLPERLLTVEFQKTFNPEGRLKWQPPPYEHNIICCCKQIYKEARPILLNHVMVKLTGELIIYQPTRIARAMGDENWLTARTSPIVQLIPEAVRRNVTKVDCQLLHLRPPALLNAFPNLQLLQLSDDLRLSAPYGWLEPIFRAPIKCDTVEELMKLSDGGLDEEIVRVHIKRLNGLSFNNWQRKRFDCVMPYLQAHPHIRLHVSAIGYFRDPYKFPRAVHNPMKGQTIRVVTYDFETKRIVEGKTLFRQRPPFRLQF